MWATALYALIPLVIIGYAHGRMLHLDENCEPRGRDECGHGMLCEQGNYQVYRCKAAPMCVTAAAKKREDIESGRLQDADPNTPLCDNEGNYKPRQCYRTPFSPDTFCNCVDRYTGRILDGYSMSFDSFGRNSDPENNMTCACAQRRAIYIRQGDPFPQCEQKTGNYLPVRCGDKSCACVDFYGRPLTGYKIFRQGESKCLCARDRYAYSLLQIIGLKFNCDQLGRYETVQCRGSVCFCADERGQERRDRPSVPIHLISTLRC